MYEFIKRTFFGYTKNGILSRIFGFCFGYCVVFTLFIVRFADRVVRCPVVTTSKTTTYNFQIPEEDFLLIVVMTTRKHLKTRATDIAATWGHQVPGSVLFFVGGPETYDGNLPVVTLSHINDTMYPPQLKLFAMLKYVFNNMIDNYEWFLRADDDLFVNTRQLEKLLRVVNSSKLLYIGQPGFGLKDEIDKLDLNGAFCMGGPGVIFTRSTLRQISNHLDDCLQTTVTPHEDTELGRCVFKFAGIQCSLAYELHELFVHSHHQRFQQYNTTLGKTEEKAITLHPIKQHPHMYRIHSTFYAIHVKNLQTKLFSISKEIQQIDDLLRERQQQTKNLTSKDARYMTSEKVSNSTIVTNLSENEKQEKKRGRLPVVDKLDLSEWDFIEYHQLYSIHNMYHVPEIFMPISSKFTSKVMADNALKFGSKYKYKRLPISYLRLTRGKLMEVISVKKTPNNNLLTERTIQHFSGIQAYDLTDPMSSTIWMILPVYMRSQQFRNFFSMLTRCVTKYTGTVMLQITLYFDQKGEYLTSKHILDMQSNSESLHINVTFVNETFSRAKALAMGYSALTNASLLLLMDVDMFLDDNFLNRVIRKTIHNKQVYFPICFSQFDPRVICSANENNCNTPPTTFNETFGIWRSFGFGIVAIYKGDLDKVGGLIHNIKGWGLEDDDLYQKCIKSDLKVFRAPDPSLVHIYHQKQCARNLPKPQYISCMASRNEIFGDYLDLVELANRLKLLDN